MSTVNEEERVCRVIPSEANIPGYLHNDVWTDWQVTFRALSRYQKIGLRATYVERKRLSNQPQPAVTSTLLNRVPSYRFFFFFFFLLIDGRELDAASLSRSYISTYLLPR
jgi:hypothetical protein